MSNNSRKLVVQDFLTLNGIMQGPGTKDEDTRGGFKDGGWMIPYFEEALVKFMIDNYIKSDALLFGRKTYETFAAYWSTVSEDANPFVKEMNRLTKYVVSNNSVDLKWKDSYAIKGNIQEEIAKLKQQSGRDIRVLGSSVLVQTLVQHNLVDEYVLMISPIVLGNGRSLFPEGSPGQGLTLVDSSITDKGVVIVTYRVSK